MIRTLFFTIVVFTFSSCKEDEVIVPEKIYQGDVLLVTQQEVDDFGSELFTVITGNLNIGEYYGLNASIENIESLKHLTSIEGDLNFNSGLILQTMNGLNRLSKVKSLNIRSSLNIVNLNGLESLTSVNSIRFKFSSKLANIDALSNVTKLSNLIIEGTSILNLHGLRNLTSDIDSVSIRHNDQLENLNDLIGLTSINENLIIYGNDNIVNLDGLNSITSVGQDLYIIENDNILNLDALTKIESVGGNLKIRHNSRLADLCGLKSVLQNNMLKGSYDVTGNAYNPKDWQIVIDDCKL